MVKVVLLLLVSILFSAPTIQKMRGRKIRSLFLPRLLELSQNSDDWWLINDCCRCTKASSQPVSSSSSSFSWMYELLLSLDEQQADDPDDEWCNEWPTSSNIIYVWSHLMMLFSCFFTFPIYFRTLQSCYAHLFPLCILLHYCTILHFSATYAVIMHRN